MSRVALLLFFSGILLIGRSFWMTSDPGSHLPQEDISRNMDSIPSPEPVHVSKEREVTLETQKIQLSSLTEAKSLESAPGSVFFENEVEIEIQRARNSSEFCRASSPCTIRKGRPRLRPSRAC
ncbi:MAG: hypothetical protein AAF203_08215, partial [Pseudomonadota bacterium]